MMYFGKSVHLSHDLSDMRDEVKVFQQHCGGENLCVYKGLLREGGQCEDRWLCLLDVCDCWQSKHREGGHLDNRTVYKSLWANNL